MAVHSAGIVLWRRVLEQPEILLVHPGGPYWKNKDEHAWSIPKGEFDPVREDAFDAAVREFTEELGVVPPIVNQIELEPFRAGSKKLYAWLLEGDFNEETIKPEDTARSNVEMEWPPRSGQMIKFPEVDRAAWVALETCQFKLHKGQLPLVDLVRIELS